MISSLTLSLFIKLIKVGSKLNALPFTYDKSTCRIKSLEPKQRLKFLICFNLNHFYGNVQFLVVVWRALIDNYPVSLLLQEFVVPIGYGLYSLMSMMFLVYEKEIVNLLNQLMQTNQKLRQLFWISDKEKDGLELLLLSLFNNTISIVFLRLILLFIFSRFNNLYAYYLYKMGPGSESFVLKYSYYIWDWFTTAQFMTNNTLSAVIFFIFVNSNIIWCKRMILIFIEFQPKALREQIVCRYRVLQLNHRLFTFVFLQKVFPLALAACTIDLILFLFIILKFYQKLGIIAVAMIFTVIVTVVVVVWVLLYFSFQLTNSSQHFLRIFRRQKGESKLGKVTHRALEPLFVRIGFAYTATESTVLTLFRIVLEAVVNLLIAVD